MAMPSWQSGMSDAVRDYLVRVEPGSEDLFLGKACFAVGGARLARTRGRGLAGNSAIPRPRYSGRGSAACARSSASTAAQRSGGISVTLPVALSTWR